MLKTVQNKQANSLHSWFYQKLDESSPPTTPDQLCLLCSDLTLPDSQSFSNDLVTRHDHCRQSTLKHLHRSTIVRQPTSSFETASEHLYEQISSGSSTLNQTVIPSTAALDSSLNPNEKRSPTQSKSAYQEFPSSSRSARNYNHKLKVLFCSLSLSALFLGLGFSAISVWMPSLLVDPTESNQLNNPALEHFTNQLIRRKLIHKAFQATSRLNPTIPVSTPDETNLASEHLGAKIVQYEPELSLKISFLAFRFPFLNLYLPPPLIESGMNRNCFKFDGAKYFVLQLQNPSVIRRAVYDHQKSKSDHPSNAPQAISIYATDSVGYAYNKVFDMIDWFNGHDQSDWNLMGKINLNSSASFEHRRSTLKHTIYNGDNRLYQYFKIVIYSRPSSESTCIGTFYLY
jgi:hypothetical protein